MRGIAISFPLSLHLNSVHRWTVLQLDLGTLKDCKDNPPTSQSKCVSMCTQRNMVEREREKMIENLLPW